MGAAASRGDADPRAGLEVPAPSARAAEPSAVVATTPSKPPPVAVKEDSGVDFPGMSMSSLSFQDIVRRLGGASALMNTTATSPGGTQHDTEEEKSARRTRFAEEVRMLRTRFEEDNKGFLNPRASYMQYWDFTTGLCLLFTAIVTPFGARPRDHTQADTAHALSCVSCPAAHLSPVSPARRRAEVATAIPTAMGALFLVNQIVNCIFIADIGAQVRFSRAGSPRRSSGSEGAACVRQACARLPDGV
jgi:hypothetical protein